MEEPEVVLAEEVVEELEDITKHPPVNEVNIELSMYTIAIVIKFSKLLFMSNII